MGDNEGRVRFPSLELWATHNQSILADRGRPLTGAELARISHKGMPSGHSSHDN